MHPFPVPACLMILMPAVSGETELARIFDHHMVLQQGQALPVFGTDNPGQRVTITIASQEKTATADSTGHWQIELDPLPASNRQHLTLTARGSSIASLDDILIGEVWLAAGQSNMDWTVKRSSNKPQPGQFPLIRMANWDASVGASGGQVYHAGDFNKLTRDHFYSGTWQALDHASVLPQSAVAYFFANALARELGDTPIGIVDISVGGTLAEAFIAPDILRADPDLRAAFENPREARTTGQWAAGRISRNLTGHTHPDPSKPHPHPFAPGFLYETGMKHIVPFRFPGIIWYQGESNAEFTTGPYQWNGDRLADYQTHVLKTLITSWREALGNPELPFYQVQLPRINAPNRVLWPYFREAQSRAAAELDNVEQAVVTEFGSSGSNVHPPDKKPVGERLAAIALHKVYRKPVSWSGPTLKDHRIVGSSIALKFDHSGRGLTTTDGEDLRGFEIAGADRRFVTATARANGDSLRLSAPDVPSPVAIRYAWHMNADGNLANSDGLGASPFRTDRWITSPGRTIRVACIGDSITAGVGTKNPAQDSYPAQLATRLDPALFEVRGFGHSGAGVHRPANKFDRHSQYRNALAYKPDIVICNLGINDITHWGSYTREEFIGEYRKLVDAFACSGEAPLIIVWHPLAPLFPGQQFHGSPNLETLNAWIADAAALTGVLTIDLHDTLAGHPEWFPDHIHPNGDGARAIAEMTADFLKELESN